VVGREVKRLAALGCSLQSSQRRGEEREERGWQAAPPAALETLLSLFKVATRHRWKFGSKQNTTINGKT